MEIADELTADASEIYILLVAFKVASLGISLSVETDPNFL